MTKHSETTMVHESAAQTAVPIIQMAGVTKWYGDVQVLTHIQPVSTPHRAAEHDHRAAKNPWRDKARG